MGIATPCILHPNKPDASGYVRVGRQGRRRLAHVWTWEDANGPKPSGMEVMHLCDENYAPGDKTYRRCHRLDHLKLGTRGENVQHMVELGRGFMGGTPPRFFGDEHWSHRMPERVHHKGGTKGELRPAAKLTDTDVRAIRALRGTMTQVAIAQQFGVNKYLIRDIYSGKRWSHVT